MPVGARHVRVHERADLEVRPVPPRRPLERDAVERGAVRAADVDAVRQAVVLDDDAEHAVALGRRVLLLVAEQLVAVTPALRIAQRRVLHDARLRRHDRAGRRRRRGRGQPDAHAHRSLVPFQRHDRIARQHDLVAHQLL